MKYSTNTTTLNVQLAALLVGGLSGWMSSIAWSHISSRLFATIEVSGKEELFNDLSCFLLELLDGKSFTANAAYDHQSPQTRQLTGDKNYKVTRPVVKLSLGWISTTITYNNCTIWVRMFNNGSNYILLNGNDGEPAQSITISTWIANAKQLQELINDAANHEAAHKMTTIKTWIPLHGRFWQTVKTTTITETCSLDAPILSNNMVDAIMTDARKFIQNRDLYDRLTMPYRRGYLFHGAPGSGKTTMIRRMARELQASIYIPSLYTDNKPISLEDLIRLLGLVVPNSIVVLEDIDTDMASAASRDNDTPESKPLLGTLLNAIDGLASPTGLIFVATTNHLDRLDSALIRSGRFDMHVEFHAACASTAKRAAKLRFPDATPSELDSFGENIENLSEPVSMADIQSHLFVSTTIVESIAKKISQ